MITGGRMSPAWFCLGGVPNDLPDGWKQAVEMFMHDFDKQLDAFINLLVSDPIFRSRTEGVGVISSQTAVDWGLPARSCAPPVSRGTFDAQCRTVVMTVSIST